MANVSEVITLGVGTPSTIPYFLTLGLGDFVVVAGTPIYRRIGVIQGRDLNLLLQGSDISPDIEGHKITLDIEGRESDRTLLGRDINLTIEGGV